MGRGSPDVINTKRQRAERSRNLTVVHAVMVAIGSKVLTPRLCAGDPDEAFTAGLLVPCRASLALRASLAGTVSLENQAEWILERNVVLREYSGHMNVGGEPDQAVKDPVRRD